MAVTARVRVPKQAKRGELIEIRTSLIHPMETGYRVDDQGGRIARKIINRFLVTYNGTEVFEADWGPGVAANPYLSFHLRASESGTIGFAWIDDDGTVIAASADIEVA